VSHSAKEREARSLLRGVSKALREAGFDPYVADERMKRGAEYKEELYEQLRNCSGAILLLSPSALSSDWVYDEAVLLAERHRQEKGEFPLLPFLIAGVTREELKKSRLTRLAIPDLHSPRTDAADAAAEIVAILTELFSPPTPLYQLEAIIADRLGRVSGDVLTLVADELGMDTSRWHPRGKQHAIARQLLSTDRDHFIRAITKIISVIDDPFGFIEMIFPFTWIDRQAVVPLTEAATGPPPRLSMAINSEEERTGRWYVRRACPVPNPWRVEQALGEGGETWDQGLAGEVRTLVIGALFGYDWDAEVSDAVLAKKLKRHERLFGPICILLPSLADEVTITAMKDNFPSLIFLVLTGDHPHPGGVRMLIPLLDRNVEEESHSDYKLLTNSFQPAPQSRRGARPAGHG
jgi:TIR domain